MSDILNIAAQFHTDFHPPDMILEAKNPLPVLINKMEKGLSDYPVKYKKRSIFIFTEMMQNIQKYQAGNEGVILVWKCDSYIILESINNTSISNAEAIENEISTAKILSGTELKNAIKSRWQHTGKPGTGLLQMILKSSNFPDIKYKLLKNKIFISIKLQIHVN